MRFKALLLIFLLTPLATFSKQKTVPVQLINAKTVRVVCDAQPCHGQVLSAAEKALEKWGRYSVAQPGQDADLILSFEIGPPKRGMGHYEVLSPAGTGSVWDIATQHAPKQQEITRHWTLSILDNHQASYPTLMEIRQAYSGDDAAASKDLIYRFKREIGKGHP